MNSVTVATTQHPTSIPSIPASPKSLNERLKEYLSKADNLRMMELPGAASTSGASGTLCGIANVDPDTVLNEYMSYKPLQGDALFEKFGPGNAISYTDRPFERSKAYEEFLSILVEHDPAQFLNIHKGTPYYFMGWTAFQFRDYSRALYYLDAAVSDDLKFPDVSSQRETSPAVEFFMLKNPSTAPGALIHQHINNVVDHHLQEFNKRSGLNVSKTDLVDKFIKPLLYTDVKNRSLLTTLYTFLLNYEKRKNEIRLRSDGGGAINTFTDDLFDGARLLESLLQEAGGGGLLFGKITSLTKLSVNKNVLYPNQKLEDAENEFTNLKSSGAPFQDCAFCASYIIRNTTGHSLIWPDNFVNKKSYNTLFTSLLDSILWTAWKYWIE